VRKPKHIRDRLAKTKADAVANYHEAKAQGISIPTSKGYRLSPNPKSGYQFHIHFSNQSFSHNANDSLTPKQKRAKFRIKDDELYDYDRL
jgi:hypothetical protein